MKFRVLLATAALAATAPAQASTVFSDNFNAEATGAPAGGLTNWNTIGTVDVVGASNPYSITVAAPAGGNVIDLDGSPGPGEIVMKDAYAFNAGDTVLLSFVLGGSQRVTGTDNFFTRLIFGGSMSQAISNGVGTGVLSNLTGANGFFVPTTTFNRTIASDMPFGMSSFSFVAGTAGFIRLAFGSTSSDNIGPLLDNVSLSVSPSAVPEPATWMMMLLGFGFVGAMLRGRSPIATQSAGLKLQPRLS
jgi:PEP-CTERM motif